MTGLEICHFPPPLSPLLANTSSSTCRSYNFPHQPLGKDAFHKGKTHKHTKSQYRLHGCQLGSYRWHWGDGARRRAGKGALQRGAQRETGASARAACATH